MYYLLLILISNMNMMNVMNMMMMKIIMIRSELKIMFQGKHHNFKDVRILL